MNGAPVSFIYASKLKRTSGFNPPMFKRNQAGVEGEEQKTSDLVELVLGKV